MARFRKRRMGKRGSYFGGRRSRGSKRSGGISWMDMLMAGAAYGVARPIVANALPTMFSFGPVDSDNVVLGAAGYMASRQSGFIKALGLVAISTEAGIVTSRLVSGNTTAAAASAAYDY